LQQDRDTLMHAHTVAHTEMTSHKDRTVMKVTSNIRKLLQINPQLLQKVLKLSNSTAQLQQHGHCT